MEALTKLFLMEQFKNCLPRDLNLHLAERGITTVKEAAELADTWEVIHYGGVGRGYQGKGQEKRKALADSKNEAGQSGGDGHGPVAGSGGGTAPLGGQARGGGAALGFIGTLSVTTVNNRGTFGATALPSVIGQVVTRRSLWCRLGPRGLQRSHWCTIALGRSPL